MKINRLTFAFLILVFVTLGLSLATRSQTPGNKVSDIEALRRYQEKKGRFPVADRGIRGNKKAGRTRPSSSELSQP